MAVIGQMFPTLVDLAKRKDPNGSIAHCVEVLSKTNPIITDMAWKEGNLPTGHRVTSRSALPSVFWRRFNEGIAASKASSEQVDETCGSMEGLSKVDTGLAELSGDRAAFRADEDNAFVQSFNIEAARAIFYESTKSSPERIHGLTPRLDSTPGNPAAAQIIKADATASGNDQASIWLIGWSPDTVFGIYPKGSKAGLESDDLGKQLVRDAAGKEYTAWVTHWKWRIGVCVRDFRYVVRICNIDVSALRPDAATGANLPLVMQDAISALQDMTSCQPVFYMNRRLNSAFNGQLMGRTSNFLEWIDRGGRRVPHYLGVPITVVDALTSAESVVV